VLSAQTSPLAGPSVLAELTLSLPGVSGVHLREPEGEPLTPVVPTGSPKLPAAPDLCGRLQLHGEIARGGMGIIFKGRDTDLGRNIAVKVLQEAHAGNAESVLRFIEEAQISGQLQHPGIAPLYELGRLPDRRPYFTMKLVKGKTLAALLAARREATQDRPRLVGIFAQVCQTLAYAHARGVVHRDLKPANVMVGAFGEVQVVDWGLAKVLTEGGDANEQKTQPPPQVSVIRTLRSDGIEAIAEAGSHTQMGSVLGTPAYMAPEQARAEMELVDERADVFGLGAILCEILTGRPPFTGKPAEVLRKAQSGRLDEAYARLGACGADAELVALARRYLAAEPWDRPRNATVVATQIDAYLVSVQERLRRAELERAAAAARAKEEARTRRLAEAKAAEQRKRHRLTLALAAVVLALAVVGGSGAIWWWQERAATQREVEGALAEAQAHQAAGLWTEARVALSQAEGRLGRGGPEALRAKVRQARLDADTVAALDENRFRRVEGWEAFRIGRQTPEAFFADIFRKYGLDAPKTPPAQAVGRVQQSAIREALLVALHDWRQIRPVLGFDCSPMDEGLRVTGLHRAWIDPKEWRPSVGDLITGVGQGQAGPVVDIRGKDGSEAEKLIRGKLGTTVRLRVLPAGARESREYALARGGPLGAWLEEVLQGADDDAWRRAFRDAEAINDTQAMTALAGQAQAWTQPPAILAALARALNRAGQAEQAAILLRQAQRLHPQDFWINFDLGDLLTTAVQPARPEQAIGYYRVALAVRPGSAATKNNLAWALATCADSKLRDPRQAVEFALEALRSNTDGMTYNTLGAALYAAGQWRAAIKALQKSMDMREGGDSFDWFFLAMAHAQLGHKEEARSWYDRAVAWMDKNAPRSDELRRFRAEAAKLLGLPAGDAAPKKDRP
jgi:serine/threonine-protein kinase